MPIFAQRICFSLRATGLDALSRKPSHSFLPELYLKKPIFSGRRNLSLFHLFGKPFHHFRQILFSYGFQQIIESGFPDRVEHIFVESRIEWL